MADQRTPEGSNWRIPLMADQVNPEGLLEVSFTWPRLSGLAGPAWPRYCALYAYHRGELVGSKILPFDLDEDDVDEYMSDTDFRRYVRAQAMEDVKGWRLALRIPVLPGWPAESLDIFVERVDRDLRIKRRVVVTRGGPHTSTYTAVMARARVPLLDALLLGDLDDDDDDDDDGKKKRRNEVEQRGNSRLMEGTMKFGKTVQLMTWELPAMGETGGNPRAVVRGSVDVRMSLLRRQPRR